MTVREVILVEDCFDGSQSCRVVFDREMTREDIQAWGGLGRLEYFPDFPRPFFRLFGAGGWQMKGVEGELSVLLIVPPAMREEVVRRLGLGAGGWRL